MRQNDSNIKRIIEYAAKPIVPFYSSLKDCYGKRHLKWQISRTYKYLLGREINWDCPRDLNEKINWLKLHSNPYEWAMMADKYKVREYVKSCGLEDILIPLYGHWESGYDVIKDWKELPDEFVLKCNNGNGRIKIISPDACRKNAINLDTLQLELDDWLAKTYHGISGCEPHYSLIRNCIIAEKLIKEPSECVFSNSTVDYKIWCFGGIPYGCLLIYDRNIINKTMKKKFYDLNWQEKTDYLSEKPGEQVIEKPPEWDRMLEVAQILSKDLPAVRVDLYRSNGKVYFGEMTLTPKGGFMDSFTQDALLEMGNQIHLDMSTPWNMFAT